MITERHIVAGVLLAMSPLVWAGWNWPTNAPGTWSEAQELGVCGQLYSAVVERCTVVNQGGPYVPLPSIVDTNVVFAGVSNIVYTNDGVVWTGRTVIVTNIVTTNQFGPFAYNYTDASGTYTATGTPTVTAHMVQVLVRKIGDLIRVFGGAWVDTNVFGRADENFYFTNLVYATNWAGMSAVDFPMLTEAAVADVNGGVLASWTTNKWGITNAATAFWWYGSDEGESNVVIYIGGRSNLWAKQWSANVAFNNPAGEIVWQFTNANAMARYIWATGAPVSVTMNFSGTRVFNTNAISNVTQAITFTNDAFYTLTGLWNTVTSATNTAGTAASNDAVYVVYTNSLRYVSTNNAAPLCPRQPYWRMFQASKELLNRMVWSRANITIGANSSGTTGWKGVSAQNTYTNQALVQTSANGNYQPQTLTATEGLVSDCLFVDLESFSYLDARKFACERTFTAAAMVTNFNKRCVFYMAAGAPLEVTGSATPFTGMSTDLFYTWGFPWLQHKYLSAWTTNLTTESSVLPWGTNALPHGTTCTTNIGDTVLWEVISNSVDTAAGFGFYTTGKWLIQWDVAGGFVYVD